MSGCPPRMPLECYAARTRDGELLRESSSGGVFTELARSVLARGGVVAGAAWDRKTWQVVHRVVRDEAGLAELRGAKYVYSRFAGVFGELEACLGEGRPVLFSGVPCQIAAARRRLRDAEGLLSCGVICHSGVDEKIWLRYAAEIVRKAGSPLADVRFRDKTDGWRRGRVAFEFVDPRRNFSMPLIRCPYILAFLSGYAARKACLSCPFRSGRAGMDILLGDFWGIEKHLPGWEDNRGASAVLVYSERGMDAWNALDLEKVPVRYEQIAAGNPMLDHCVAPDARKRARFLAAVGRRSVETAWRCAEDGPWPRRTAVRIARWLRRMVRPRTGRET